jgi:hypothetical protein
VNLQLYLQTLLSFIQKHLFFLQFHFHLKQLFLFKIYFQLLFKESLEDLTRPLLSLLALFFQIFDICDCFDVIFAPIIELVLRLEAFTPNVIYTIVVTCPSFFKIEKPLKSNHPRPLLVCFLDRYRKIMRFSLHIKKVTKNIFILLDHRSKADNFFKINHLSGFYAFFCLKRKQKIHC